MAAARWASKAELRIRLATAALLKIEADPQGRDASSKRISIGVFPRTVRDLQDKAG